MSFIVTVPREQLMMPTSINDYISFDNIVRFIDAFVDKILGLKPELLPSKGSSSEGRPSYSAACLCKLLIYGYLNQISSSRRLEKETGRNLEVIWLMNNLQPDHWTISDFRKENKKLIKQITIDFRIFLKDCGYIKGKTVSTDGTKIKAYASRDTLSLTLIDKKLEHAEKEIERYLNQLDENDTSENQNEEILASNNELEKQIAYLQKKVEELEAQKKMLEAHGRESLAPADHDAKVMKTKDGFLPAYNIQATVDNDSHLLTTCEVTDHPNDYHSLELNINTIAEQLDFLPDGCLADGGYANEEQIRSLEEQGVECIVSFPDEPENKKVQSDIGINFSYDEENDCYNCSQGKTLILVQSNCKKKKHLYNVYQCQECNGCPVKQDCTKSENGRTISRRVDGDWINEYKDKSKTKEFKEKLRNRKCVVEHPFGTIKYLMGQIPILLRGKDKVQVEIDLYATAYNLIRMKNIESVSVLLKSKRRLMDT